MDSTKQRLLALTVVKRDILKGSAHNQHNKVTEILSILHTKTDKTKTRIKCLTTVQISQAFNHKTKTLIRTVNKTTTPDNPQPKTNLNKIQTELLFLSLHLTHKTKLILKTKHL